MKRGFALAACLFLAPTAAFGAPPTDKDRARELAQTAADFLDEKKYAEALEAANQAESLYHAVFHLYVVARSLEGLGRLTEAAETYERVLAEPLPASAPKVFRDAQAESKGLLADLLARIPTVLVKVSGAPIETAKATLDDKPVDIASGVAMRADPGSHVVRVIADRRIDFEKTIILPNKGGVVVVNAELAMVGGQKKLADEAPVVEVEANVPTVGVQTNSRNESMARGGSFVPAILAFGVGSAGLAFGGAMGALELGKVKDLEKRCPNKMCPLDAQGDFDKAHQLATLSTVGFVVGGAGVAAGVVLLVVRKKAPANASSGALVVPWVVPGRVGLAGTF